MEIINLYWNETFDFRNEIAKQKKYTVEDHLREYLCLSHEIGYDLIKVDAIKRHATLNKFSPSNWDHIADIIIKKFSINLKRRSPHIQEMYNNFKDSTNSELKKLGALILLPHLIEPVKFSKFGKPSKSDVQKSFIAHFKVFWFYLLKKHLFKFIIYFFQNLKEAEEDAEKHPHIVIIGESLNQIEKAYFNLGERKFCFNQPLDAFNYCFFSFIGLNISYPGICNHIWYFIQVAIFNLIIPEQLKVPVIEEFLHEFKNICN